MFPEAAAPDRRSGLQRRNVAIWAKVAALATFLAACLVFASPARAEFLVCNQTLDVVNVAVGQQASGTFRTEGWWTVGSNQCATVIREDLEVRYLFVYATDVFGQPILDGATPMCVGGERFTIEGTEECWQRGYREAMFVEVDTKATSHWTLFLGGDGGN